MSNIKATDLEGSLGPLNRMLSAILNIPVNFITVSETASGHCFSECNVDSSFLGVFAKGIESAKLQLTFICDKEGNAKEAQVGIAYEHGIFANHGGNGITFHKIRILIKDSGFEIVIKE